MRGFQKKLVSPGLPGLQVATRLVTCEIYLHIIYLYMDNLFEIGCIYVYIIYIYINYSYVIITNVKTE